MGSLWILLPIIAIAIGIGLAILFHKLTSANLCTERGIHWRLVFQFFAIFFLVSVGIGVLSLLLLLIFGGASLIAAAIFGGVLFSMFLIVLLWRLRWCLWRYIKEVARDAKDATRQIAERWWWGATSLGRKLLKKITPTPIPPTTACQQSVKIFQPDDIPYTEFETDGPWGSSAAGVQATALNLAKEKAEQLMYGELNVFFDSYQCSGKCIKVPYYDVQVIAGPTWDIQRGSMYDSYRCTITVRGTLKIVCQ